MAIIDTTYFWGLNNLPFTATGSGTTAVISTKQTAEINKYITMYEDEFLGLVFGGLKSAYVDGRTTEKWKAVDALLVNATALYSPIADYVFYKYWMDKDVLIDGSTTFKSERKDSIVLPNSVKANEVWNRMIDKLIPVLEYISENRATLEEGETATFDDCDWSEFVYSNIIGCGWATFPRYKNSFGL